MKNSNETPKPKHPPKVKRAMQLLNSYFIGMIENKNYSVVKASEYTVEVRLTSGEKFCFWIANGKEKFRSYHDTGDNFLKLNLHESQQSAFFDQLIEDKKVFEKSTPETERRRAEYLKLKEEFEGNEKEPVICKKCFYTPCMCNPGL